MWLSDEELAASQEESAADLGRRVEALTRDIKALEASGDFEAAERKKRLRRLFRRDRKQLRENSAALRAGLAQKAPVGISGTSGRAAPMERW
jgi:hypothetical protein